MQNSGGYGGSETGVKESKLISNELATAINEGLYFYEQVDDLYHCCLWFTIADVCCDCSNT